MWSALLGFAAPWAGDNEQRDAAKDLDDHFRQRRQRQS